MDERQKNELRREDPDAEKYGVPSHAERDALAGILQERYGSQGQWGRTPVDATSEGPSRAPSDGEKR